MMANGIFAEDFLLGNLWWIVLAALLLLFAGFFFLEGFLSRRKAVRQTQADREACLEALGGAANIVSAAKEGSRIVLRLRDYGKIDEAKLKKAGIASFIRQSDKLTLIAKDKADEIYEAVLRR